MNLARRHILALLALTAAPSPRFAFAQSAVLPVDTQGLDHLDVIVPVVEKPARFYMGLFRTRLHAQPVLKTMGGYCC